MTARIGKERALEVALYAERTTDAEAASHFSMPRRTVSALHRRYRGSPELARMVEVVGVRLADRYAELEEKALLRVQIALGQASTPPRDIARILDVLARERALLTGAVTARSESASLNLNVSPLDALTFEERDRLRDTIDAVLAADHVEQALVTLPDPTAALDRTAIFGLIAAIERRLDSGR